ncbi:MAG: hypothetical protein HY319_03120 [Armatimonadetes bacterium]|nr:hypothetical protein [Armatimonadota bacterium]
MMRVFRAALCLLLFLSAGGAAAQTATCSHCGKPILGRGYRLSDGRTVCEAHLEAALPRCKVCEQAMSGAYRLVGERETPVCDTCMEKYPHCWVCGEPVPPKRGRHLKDGRYLCNIDRKTAIFSPHAAGRLFDQARREVVRSLGPALVAPVGVEKVLLVDTEGMARAAADMEHEGKSPSGLTRIKVSESGGKRRHHPPTVFLLSGMPREEFLTVAAHEYGHVWHSQAHPDYFHCSRRLREGFAEWVAYKVLVKMGREGQLKKLLSGKSDSDYSEGLRRVLALEKSVGAPGVLKYVVRNNDL